jgi:hypothetical protein
MAALVMYLGLYVRRLLNSFGEGFANFGSTFQQRPLISEGNDGTVKTLDYCILYLFKCRLQNDTQLASKRGAKLAQWGFSAY